MKQLLTLLFILAGLFTQPLFAEVSHCSTDTILAEETAGDGDKPPTDEEEEEEPDCE